jgi:ribosomal protein S27AE
MKHRLDENHKRSDGLKLTETLSCTESVDKKQEQFPEQLDITRLLGSCPICNSVVSSDSQRAVCRKCGAWCWIERWKN